MDAEQFFEFVFGNDDIREQKTDDEDIKSLYIQYLLENHNKTAKTGTHFDWGVIGSNNNRFFLWGTRPSLILPSILPRILKQFFFNLSESQSKNALLNSFSAFSESLKSLILMQPSWPIYSLLASEASCEDFINNMSKDSDLCTIFSGMKFCAKRGKKVETLGKIADWESKRCGKGNCEIKSCVNNLISLIVDDPLVLGLSGVQDLKNSDMVFFLSGVSKSKILSVELKFGKSQNELAQSIINHIILSNLFAEYGNVEVISFVFSPYELSKDIKETFLKELLKNKSADLPVLLIKGIPHRERIKSCFGKFSFDQKLLEELKNQRTVEGKIEEHLEMTENLLNPNPS